MSFSSSNRALAVRFMLAATVCLFLGFKGAVKTLPLDQLEIHKGHLEWIKGEYIKPKDSDKVLYGVMLKLKESEQTFGTWVDKNEKIISNNVKKNSEIELWIDGIEGKIVQIKIDDFIVVKYNQFKAMRFHLVLALIGFIFLTMMIISIIKHPEIISAKIAKKKGIKF